MRAAARAFWAWYERHHALNLAVATGLFLLQIVHLFWLTTDVVFARLFGRSFFDPQGPVEFAILLIDYTEIPALIGVSLIYLNELRRRFTWRNVAFLVLLNSQWLHILWITDEFVVASLTGEAAVALPAWLAWIAIGIDYLELPVMVDTLAKLGGRIVGRGRASLAGADDRFDR
jgi:hypothetical protein